MQNEKQLCFTQFIYATAQLSLFFNLSTPWLPFFSRKARFVRGLSCPWQNLRREKSKPYLRSFAKLCRFPPKKGENDKMAKLRNCLACGCQALQMAHTRGLAMVFSGDMTYSKTYRTNSVFSNLLKNTSHLAFQRLRILHTAQTQGATQLDTLGVGLAVSVRADFADGWESCAP